MGASPVAAAAVAACILVAGAATRAPTPKPQTRFVFAAPHMGTEFRITLYADDQALAARAANAAFARIAALDRILSDYRADSELTRLAARAPLRLGRSRGLRSGQAGEPVRVSDDLFRVLSHAQRVARASAGAFDPTVGPLTKLWRRARRTNEFPSDAEVRSARDRVGYEALTLDEAARTVRLGRENMGLDLGGIAKGFAADEAAAVLNDHGIRRALVAAGGDIAAIGAPPESAGWTIAIASLDAGAHARTITLRDAAVSTSGDREQWMMHDGTRYSHIIDPRTGRPVVGPSSVTVIAPTATDSDALATAVAVLGPEKGLKVIEAASGAAALIQRVRDDRVETLTSRRWTAQSTAGQTSSTVARSAAAMASTSRVQPADSSFSR